MKVGVGLKPGTKIDVVTEWVDQGLVDMVLVMTVEPGFGGQSFMAGMMPKVEALRQAYPTLDIEVSCLKVAKTNNNFVRSMEVLDQKQLVLVQQLVLT